MIEEKIISALQKATGNKEIQLETPENEEFGDYTTNVALQSKDKNPRKFAEEIVEKLKANKKLKEYVEKIDVAGPGFINFWFNKKYLYDTLNSIVNHFDVFKKSKKLKNQKIMVEFAHPNTHKAFHIGHLRNIITGESLVRLLESQGARVVRVNYQGDVGMHIAKCLWGYLNSDLSEIEKRIGKALNNASPNDKAEVLGSFYAIGSQKFETDDKAKLEIEEINSQIYTGNPKIWEIYQKTRRWSLEYFDCIYKRLYTTFDRLYFESEVFESGKEKALDALKNKIFEVSDGAIIFPGSKYGLHDRVFVSSKGTPTYEAKELGLAALQFGEHNPDKIIHLVSTEQIGYFQVLIKALEIIMPESKGKEVHQIYGWVKLKEGKMSSRMGNVVLGEMLLDETKKEIKKNYDADEVVAEQIAVGAVKYSFLKVGLTQEITYDIKESVSSEGNSGPYIQYTYARTNSVKQKSNKEISKLSDLKEALNTEERSLLRSFTRFPGILVNATKNYSPSILCSYLYDLSQKYNAFYNKHKIIDSDNEGFRLAINSATGKILKKGLDLLGIQAPERM